MPGAQLRCRCVRSCLFRDRLPEDYTCFITIHDFLLVEKIDQFCDKDGIKCGNVLEMLNVVFGKSPWKKHVFTTDIGVRKDVTANEHYEDPSTPTIDNKMEKVKKITKRSAKILVYQLAHGLPFFLIFQG